MADLPTPQAARDRGHETYDYWRYKGRGWEWFRPVLARMHPAQPVLDVGAGIGLFVECCLKSGVKAVGLELSKEGVTAMAARGLPAVRADLWLPFPFRDDSFGSALAHHVLEHIPPGTERAVLREIRRILRPGGFLYVISPNRLQPGATDPDHVNLFTPHELRDQLRAAGFSRVSLGTNYWRPVWEPTVRLGRIGGLLSGALWKVAPVDRCAGSASAMAWK